MTKNMKESLEKYEIIYFHLLQLPRKGSFFEWMEVLWKFLNSVETYIYVSL